MKYQIWIESAALFLFGLGWFALFQPWGFFPDPDAFYHAKMVELISMQGPVQQFPWLDLTTLGAHFADQHFLFHIFLIPFVRLFGMLLGTQIASVIFAAAFLVILYGCLRALRVRFSAAWTILLAVSSALMTRLLLAKASPLAIAWFVLGLTALALRRRALAFITGVGFALSHGGWIILLACQALYVCGETVYVKIVDGMTWKKFFVSSGIRIFFWTAAGVLAGMLIHPNARALIGTLWVQIVKIGIGTPFERVFLGTEWLPVTPGEFISGIAFLLIAGLFVVLGLIVAPRKPLHTAFARRATAFAFPVAATLALTLKSRRGVEYLLPALTLWIAQLFMLLDHASFFAFLKQRRRTLVVVGALMILLVIHDAQGTYDALHHSNRSFDEFAGIARVLRREAHPGDRVFHAVWDQFPQLFVADDRLRYVAGLDPTFLLEARPELSDLYRDFTMGAVTSSAHEVIRDRFGASFVFAERGRTPAFEETLVKDPGFVRLYEDEKTILYRVR